MSQRHLVIDCAICGGGVLLKYAIPVPRVDAHGELTHEIATYVCGRSKCFWKARLETVRRLYPVQATDAQGARNDQ